MIARDVCINQPSDPGAAQRHRIGGFHRSRDGPFLAKE